MQKSAKVFLIISVVLLGACSNESEERREARTDDHIWKTQTDALDKARSVDKLIQDGAEKKRKKIDEQSHLNIGY